MNFSSIFGVILGLGVFGSALLTTTENAKIFLDEHGILIVCGGTLAAASISFPITKLLALFKIFLQRVLGQNQIDYQATVNEILELNKRASLGPTALNDALSTIRHPFLKEAVQLVAAGVLSEKEVRHALEQRLKTIEHRYLHEANMFRTIGRFPPAFGLLAATLGMIGVLQRMGEADAAKMIGPAMSVGLVGTLYGIALANLVFLPIAENLTERTQEEVALRKMIIEGALLLKTQVNPVTMRETMNSFLMPKDRVTRKAA